MKNITLLLLCLLAAVTLSAVEVDGFLGKTVRVRLVGLDESACTFYRARGTFGFSTILFEPNDDFKWSNHSSYDNNVIELGEKDQRFILKTKGIAPTTIHRVNFSDGSVELATRPKDGGEYGPHVYVHFYSKANAVRIAKAKKEKGIDARIVKLDGATVKLVRYEDQYGSFPSYIEPEDIVYYLSPFTSDFALDVSNVKK